MATLRATTSFHAMDRFVAAGDEVDSSDPVVKGREALFTSDVEQATAAPGERRAKAPARKAAAKKSV